MIAPFGVGSLITSVEGVSAIVAGLDHWIDSGEESFDESEFISDEWRLSRELGVDRFILPPDFRVPFGYSTKDSPNSFLALPALRFPLWNFCPSCKTMAKVSPYEMGLRSCGSCEKKKNNGEMKYASKVVQIQFLALCRQGHIQDFPYREWVHREVSPSCRGDLKVSFSGATLATQRVKCDCGKSRSFDGIFGTIDTEGTMTNLSNRLSSGETYLCQGIRPWLDDFQGEGCDEQLIGGIKGAINNYYAHVRSAIYLPKNVVGAPSELIELLQRKEFSNFLEATDGISGQKVLEMMQRLPGLRDLIRSYVERFDVASAIDAVRTTEPSLSEESELHVEGDRLKLAEYECFTSGESVASQMLKMEEISIGAYSGNTVSKLFSKVVLIDRLKETRALVGFSRIRPDLEKPLGELRKMLRRSEGPHDRWLPAYEVYGEGIFLDLNTEALRAWAQQAEVAERVEALRGSDSFLSQYPNVTDSTFLPRLVALHTLAHLLINQMVFGSGYAAASLRERIYCLPTDSDQDGTNGILIYTASGDSEGSMGGLVRSGKPGKFETLLEASLDGAQFCSSDPVCMEFGEQGQGPDSLNLAACHNCALLPETSCERFNTFLDRALIVGSFKERRLGLLNGQD
jgi:hypothetical protein